LFNQMALRGEDLNSVEAGAQSIRGRDPILPDDRGDFGGIQLAMRRRWHQALGRRDDDVLALRKARIDRGRDRLDAGECFAGGASGVPELDEHNSTLSVNGRRDLPPSRDLFVAPDAGRLMVGSSLRGDGGGLGDDETAVGRALAVVLKHQVRGNGVRPVGAEPTERRHHDAMFEGDGAELNRRKEVGRGGLGHSLSL
jgi:hypothetical protein